MLFVRENFRIIDSIEKMFFPWNIYIHIWDIYNNFLEKLFNKENSYDSTVINVRVM